MIRRIARTAILALTVTTLFSPPRPGWAQDATAKRYLITNDNSTPNTVTFYEIVGPPTAPTLQFLTAAGTGYSGSGDIALNKAAKLIVVTKVGNDACAYASNIDSNNITGFVIPKQQYAGTFSSGSTSDVGLRGLASNGTYLYANFSSANSIATFQTTAGCGLSFVGDYSTKSAGPVSDMALQGNMLVVTFGDGYIESFNTSAGMPVSNGDLQPPAGESQFLFPDGVDISKGGDYAVFADTGGSTAVEVSAILSGNLTPPRLYNSLGTGTDSTNVMLSPSDTLLYITDQKSAQVTAARFKPANGAVSFDCISPALVGSFVVPGNLALETTSGTGDVVFVAQGDADSMGGNEIGALAVTVTPGTCTLTGLPSGYPVSVSGAFGLQSIAVYPPRPF
jgi:hypothetical protein